MTFFLRVLQYVVWAVIVVFATVVVVEVTLWTTYFLRKYLFSRIRFVFRDILGGLKNVLKKISPPKIEKENEK